MNFEQLKYIVEVAKAGSLSSASKKLFITQSAISQSITNLEAELGVKIFIRSRNGAIPTNRGNAIIKKAFETLAKMEDLKTEANMDDQLINGKLRLGTIPSPLMYLPKTLASFKKDYPKIRISEKSSHNIIDDITEDKLDIGLIGLGMEDEDFKNKDIETKVVLRGKMIVAASKQSPLAFANSVSPQEIQKTPLVIYDDDRMWEFIGYMSSRYGEMDILFSTNNLDAIRNAIIENLSITIAPDYTIKNDPYVLNDKAVPIEINNLAQDYPGMALVWSKSRSTIIIKNFLSRLTTDMQKLKRN